MIAAIMMPAEMTPPFYNGSISPAPQQINSQFVNIPVDQNGRPVNTVKHVLLLQHRKILADRHLRDLHQRRERRYRDCILLTHDLHDTILPFVQMNHLVRLLHYSIQSVREGGGKSHNRLPDEIILLQK